jgi:hypothetical protein
MRLAEMPKQLTDEQIRGVVQTLQQRQFRITGLAVRTELRRLYGTPGGVNRVYKLINEPQSAALIATPSDSYGEFVSLIEQLKEQLALAMQRAELAEHREQAHQEKWAMEIDQLRQQLRAAQIDSRKLSEAQNLVLELRREIHRLNSGLM